MINHKLLKKILAPAILALSLTWLPQPAFADDWQVSQWPQEPGWVVITNHLTACYNAVCQRYQAVGVSPSSVPGPSFVYIYNDYLALGQALDSISSSYLVQTNADGNGCFDAWLAAHPTNSLPTWVVTNLHAYCGFTNWGNNSLLTSWDVCDHSIATQVVQVCAALSMASLSATPVNPASSYTNVMTWSGTNWSIVSTNLSVHGPVAWPQGSLVIDTHTNITATRSGSRIGVAGGCYTGAVSTRTLYLKGNPAFSTWNAETFVGTLYTDHYASRSASVSTSSATNSFLDDFTQGYGTIPFYNPSLTSPVSKGWVVGGGFWVMNWQFSSVPMLTVAASAAPVPPDTDLDGLVNGLKGAHEDIEPYGSISYLSDWNQPFVRIPLAIAPSHGKDLALKVELTSGRGQGLPYRYAIPAIIEQADWPHYGAYQGPNIFLNTDTRVLECGVVTNGSQHVKQVSVLRPYGRLVVFDFPWTNGAFSVFGYGNRTENRLCCS